MKLARRLVALTVALAAASFLATRVSVAQAKPSERLPVAFSPDGKIVAAGAKDGKIKLWDAATLKPVRMLQHHAIKICALAFAPDSSLLFAGCEDGTVQIYNVAKGDVFAQASVPNEVEPITALAVSSDGKRLVYASQNRAVQLFDLVTSEDRKGEKHAQCKLAKTFRRPAGAMASVAFSPEDKGVLAGGSEHVVVLWNAETKAEQGAVEAHKDLITRVSYTSDGKRFLTASLDGTVKLWEVGAGKPERTLDAHEGGVSAAVFTHDGKQVVTGGKNGWMKMWETETGKFEKAMKCTAAVLSLDVSPDKTRIVVATADRAVKLWDTQAAKELAVLPAE